MINKGDTVYVLEGAGSIIKGIFTAEKSEGMFAILIDGKKTIFKRMSNIFTDRLTAQARWLISRYKRLQMQGIPLADDIVFAECDREALELATELWPEQML